MSNKHKKQENNKIRLISEKEQEMLDYPDLLDMLRLFINVNDVKKCMFCR